MRRVLPPEKPPPVKAGPVIAVLLVLVLLGAGAYIGYKLLSKPSAAQPSGVEAVTPAPKPAPAVSLPPVPPAQPDAQQIDRAKAAIDAHAQTAVEPVNEVLNEQTPAAPAPTPVVSAPPAPAPAPAAPPAAAPPAAAPAPAAQTVRVDQEPPPAASPAFKAFISNLVVNGVFLGDTPRVLINNTTYEVGDVINSDLGVVFTGIDPDRKEVLFKDSTGVTLVKKY
jgi:hypothetical protein